MKISVFGLGYVGVVTASCLSKEGHEVIGVDIDKAKTDLVNHGQSPIIEQDVDALVKQGVQSGRLRAVKDVRQAVDSSDMAIICVGTPSKPNGALDNQYLIRVTQQLGTQLRDRSRPFLVVVRSTVAPGTLRNLVIPTLEEASGRKSGEGYRVLFHPEFLREGTSVHDFYSPPKIVIGEQIQDTAGPLLDIYGSAFDTPRIVCNLEVAEMVKYCDNLFHALKITFSNEIGQVCHALQINSQEVMRIFCQDKKLNISGKYLMPGFAFGGSCLPKDLRAFLMVARDHDINTPTLTSILESNTRQVERAVRVILDYGKNTVGFYGLAFKEGTDDLRESPYVDLAERLIGKGCHLTIYDESVQIARLVGGNKSYIVQRLPHLSDLLCDGIEYLDKCPLLVLCHRAPEQQVRTWLKAGKQLLDLTGRDDFANYDNFYSIV